MAKRGRKPMSLDKLPENWEALLVECGSQGHSMEQMHQALGISRAGWISLQKSSEEFNEATQLALEASEAWWIERGRLMACGVEGNATVWIFNMKNRFGWRDVRDINHRHEVTREQLEAEIQSLGVEPDQLWDSLH